MHTEVSPVMSKFQRSGRKQLVQSNRHDGPWAVRYIFVASYELRTDSPSKRQRGLHREKSTVLGAASEAQILNKGFRIRFVAFPPNPTLPIEKPITVRAGESLQVLSQKLGSSVSPGNGEAVANLESGVTKRAYWKLCRHF